MDREFLKDKRKIVVKVGTSSLTYANGRLNFQRIERLAMIISNIRNSGRQICLVTSGAIAVGSGRMGLDEKPATIALKQAMAAIGQAELMKIYQKFFDEYDQMIAQVLLTKDVMINPVRKKNARNTLNTLLDMNIVPIINENDTVATDEIEFGDNDTLSAYVAALIQADLLIILSDIDGLYTANPRTNPDAKIIHVVQSITPEIEEIASGKGSSFATGGMVTKIAAAKICYDCGADMVIASGQEAGIIFEILNGKELGTLFLSKLKQN